MTQISFGFHAVHALLSCRAKQVRSLSIVQSRQDKRAQQIIELADQYNIPIQWVDHDVLQTQLGDVNHQGMVAEHDAEVIYSDKELPDLLAMLPAPALILVLDGIQDPRNVGACLRTADAAGVSLVLMTKHRSSPITETVRKVACGAVGSVNLVQVTNLSRAVKVLQEDGFWIYGACAEADGAIYEQQFASKAAIMMGAEGQGLRRLSKESCDVMVSIPLQGSVSSLNVSVATGICLYEWLRQVRLA